MTLHQQRPPGFPAAIRLAPLTIAVLLIAGCSGDNSESGDNGAADADKPAADSEPATASESTTDADDTAEPEETASSTAPVESSKPAAEPAPESKSSVAVDPNATGRFFGRIVLDGEAPQLKPLAAADDENLKDKEVCGMADIPNQSLVVSEGNGIANVFVFLRPAPKGYDVTVPEEPVVLDQKGCVFTPHVALIQSGQTVLVKSSDAVQHNVHTSPSRNQSANILVSPNDQEGVEIAYPRPESAPIEVKCDIHSWMSSYHLVLDHPFMAVSDADGGFQIDGLPAGDYEFRVWHERCGLLERDYAVTVTGADEAVELKYGVDKFSL